MELASLTRIQPRAGSGSHESWLHCEAIQHNANMQRQERTVPQAIEDDPLDTSGLCLLSLDGGGVWRLSTLMILKRLMERTNPERKNHGSPLAKPCELFGLIVGTSTGGNDHRRPLNGYLLILSTLQINRHYARLPWDDYWWMYCSIHWIVKKKKKIFEKQKHKLPVNLRRNLGNVQERFDSEIREKSIQGIIESKGLHETDLFKSKEIGSVECKSWP